jgi:pimeloyl-ACP methyl ester carboxylesterase
MELHHIYCISGLGADFRIFSKIAIENSVLHPITWQMPEKGEDIPHFAERLSGQIKHDNASLLGVSFGGMLATEISKIRPVRNTIVVSSAKCRNELPMYMRAAGNLKLHKVAPYWLVTRSKYLSRFIFDVRSLDEELYLKQMMLKDTDLTFLQRAVDMILRWQSHEYPDRIVHIHGDKDKLLFPGSVKANYLVKDGGHFMIWNMAGEISKIINKELNARMQSNYAGL